MHQKFLTKYNINAYFLTLLLVFVKSVLRIKIIHLVPTLQKLSENSSLFCSVTCEFRYL
jgi:hypothetical protein